MDATQWLGIIIPSVLSGVLTALLSVEIEHWARKRKIRRLLIEELKQNAELLRTYDNAAQ